MGKIVCLANLIQLVDYFVMEELLFWLKNIVLQPLVFEDDFVRNASGKRMAGLGHDLALGMYINHLCLPQVIIFHIRFSKDNAAFSLIAIKTLSRYLGGFHVRWNAEKVIILEQ